MAKNNDRRKIEEKERESDGKREKKWLSEPHVCGDYVKMRDFSGSFLH